MICFPLMSVKTTESWTVLYIFIYLFLYSYLFFHHQLYETRLGGDCVVRGVLEVNFLHVFYFSFKHAVSRFLHCLELALSESFNTQYAMYIFISI